MSMRILIKPTMEQSPVAHYIPAFKRSVCLLNAHALFLSDQNFLRAIMIAVGF